MRGVVSLAAALAIPITLDNGTAFPQRNLILFITFIVILLTLVVQGLTLPYFIKRSGVYERPADAEVLGVPIRAIVRNPRHEEIPFAVINPAVIHIPWELAAAEDVEVCRHPGTVGDRLKRGIVARLVVERADVEGEEL